MGHLDEKGLGLGLFLSLGVFNLLMPVPELALRAAGFRHVSQIQFGYPRPEDFVLFTPDETLFWKLSPRPDVNSWGFFGADPRCPPEAGTYRILFLGDSCMQYGSPDSNYPLMVQEILRRVPFRQPERVECVTLAMSGYTSFQGLKTAELFAGKLKPAVACVAYGWNDHWLAYGQTDANKRIDTRLIRVYQSVRLFQLVGKLRHGDPEESLPLDKVRVSTDQYRGNLEAIWRLLHGLGVEVVFLTAPTSHGLRGVPDILLRMHFAQDKQSVLSLHREYNQIVREVASGTGALLLDFDTEFSRPEDMRYFKDDGIHFTTNGRQVAAQSVVSFLVEHCGVHPAPPPPAPH
jgi:lysophospholipase L1-like esterase